MTSIRLSKEHGVNPSVEQCFYCQKDKGLILFGRLKDDAKAPHVGVFNREPCDECKDLMSQGIILISVSEEKTTDKSNPWRTGGWVVIKEEALAKIITNPELLEAVLQQRSAFLPDAAWDMIGLPRGEDNESAV